jgi:choline dehydrogenase-like flavoprotein
MTLVTDAVAYEITRDKKTGLASGVAYVDRLTRQPRAIRAKAVLLCASTLESTRLLLNSGDGFANSSGALGHYVMDHISGSTTGVLPVGEPNRWAGSPRRPNGLYIPRFRNVDRGHTNGMIRGYGYQCNNGSSHGSPARIAALAGFGKSFKESVHDGDPWRFSLGSSCECLPRYDNFVELDPDLKDAWGIPALRMHATWSDNELRLAQDANESAAEMLEAAGATDIRMSGARTIPGGKTHEVGTARMGNDPRTSVLNRYNQSHDVKNLFVTDGAAFVTVAWQNPTLTMMTLTARACDYFIDAYRKGELG